MPTGRGLRIGRVFGIELNLDFSWLILSVVITWSLSNTFGEIVPQLSSRVHLTMGLAGAVLFFVSIVAHEMAHAVMAKRKGIDVQSITLFVFGGVARIKKDASSPGDEFLIAVVGPLMSLALGGIFYVMGWIGETSGILMAAALFQVIGFLNGALAVFNLVPGYPMDGGRILRAAIWRATGDVVKATRIAALGGRVVALLLIGGGIYMIFFGNDLVGGAWWILLGMFLNQAAQQSYQQVVLRNSVSRLKVADLMTKDPETVPGNSTLIDAVNDHFLTSGMNAFPVLGVGNVPEGLLTIEMVRGQPREAWDEVTVRTIMLPLTADLKADPEEPVTAVLERMETNPSGRFLVIEGEALVGLLSASDIARYMRVAQIVGAS